MTEPASGNPLVEFLADMRRLRAECDWKRGQTHGSLARYLLEETYEALEVLDAWESDPDPEHLCEELGDLLLQVYFHAVIAEEAGQFTLDDVARGIRAKMHRRNPHVFGTGADRPVPADAAAINDAWQEIKEAERPRASLADGIPVGLPALLAADKVLDRLARAGQPALLPSPAAAPQPSPDDLGERLLALVAEAHALGADPEQALREALRRRIQSADHRAVAPGNDPASGLG